MMKSQIKIAVSKKPAFYHGCMVAPSPLTVNLPFDGSIRRTYAPLMTWLNRLVDKCAGQDLELVFMQGSHHSQLSCELYDADGSTASFVICKTLTCSQLAMLCGDLKRFELEARLRKKRLAYDVLWDITPYDWATPDKEAE